MHPSPPLHPNTHNSTQASGIMIRRKPEKLRSISSNRISAIRNIKDNTGSPTNRMENKLVSEL